MGDRSERFSGSGNDGRSRRQPAYPGRTAVKAGAGPSVETALIYGAKLELLDDPAAVPGGVPAAGINFAPKTNIESYSKPLNRRVNLRAASSQ